MITKWYQTFKSTLIIVHEDFADSPDKDDFTLTITWSPLILLALCLAFMIV